jgi:hypothetical protein
MGELRELAAPTVLFEREAETETRSSFFLLHSTSQHFGKQSHEITMRE